MTVPYDLTIPGWMTKTELEAISEIAQALKPWRVLELGAFAGRSAVCWAKNLPASQITCVDPWFPDRIADVWWMSDDKYVWCPFTAEEKKRSLYSVFLEKTHPYPNIDHYRMFSGQFAEISARLDLKYDLIFIDGDHSPQGFQNDLDIVLGMLQLGGAVAMHDWRNPELAHMTPIFEAWNEKHGRVIKEFPDTTIAYSI